MTAMSSRFTPTRRVLFRVLASVVVMCVAAASCTASAPVVGPPGSKLLAAADVLPLGSTIVFPGGQVVVPPHATDATSTGRVLAEPNMAPSPMASYVRTIGPGVRFESSGVKPDVPVKLEVQIDPKTVANVDHASLALVAMPTDAKRLFDLDRAT
jgi:hypothetical protein